MSRTISIYIADDHPIMAGGIHEVLKTNSALQVLGIAHDGEALIAMLQDRRADLVILDINMPKMNGIQCAQWIKEYMPETKVIILTMYPEKSYIDQLLQVGADGCLLKSRGSSDLLEAINRVVAGKSYYDWISEFKPETITQRVILTQREMEVVKLIIQAKSSSEIAKILFISPETVKTHRKNIFKKLKIHHVTELMTYALNHGLT